MSRHLTHITERLLIAAFALSLVLACIPCRGEDKAADGWKEYRNESQGFRINVPTNLKPMVLSSPTWHVVFTTKTGQSPESRLNSISVHVQPGAKGDNDAKAAATKAAEAIAAAGAQVDQDTVKLGNYSAHQIAFISRWVGAKDGIKVRTRMLFFVAHGKLFQLTAAATDKSSEDFFKSAQRAFDSFELIGAENKAPRQE
jgi:hypothetical protein